jgi:hypothetical protein
VVKEEKEKSRFEVEDGDERRKRDSRERRAEW